MSELTSTKSKPPPWIPPGKGMHQYKKRARPLTILKKTAEHVPKEVPCEVTPEWGDVDVPRKEVDRNNDADTMSLSSHSSYEFGRPNQENEFDIHHLSLHREIELLRVHFASIKTSYISAHRLVDFQDVDDNSVKELLIEAGSFLKTINELFNDLEYSMSVLENALTESQKKVEFETVYRYKEKLISNLLAMYEKVMLIFQVIFEKKDVIELSRVQEVLSEKLKISEKKCSTQEAVITDLERRLSIHQSKVAAMENYKTNLESAKTDLEKKLFHKESQIKYLSTELMNASEKYAKSDREDFIDIIEQLKNKAHNDKSALKKALKFLKAQSKEKEETYKKLLEEANEKEKNMFNLAAQRDQLKVQLTVVTNNVVQLRHQIEEIKIQNLKLQDEMAEKDSSYKKEIAQLKSTTEEKSTELDETLKKKKKLEETIVELENELKKSKEHLKTLKDKPAVPKQLYSQTSKEIDVLHEDILRLVAILQSTTEIFENLTHSGLRCDVSASGDHIAENFQFGSNKEILTAVNEIKKYILELNSQLLPFLGDQKHATEPKSCLKKNDAEKQLKKMEHMYKSVLKDNELLKQKLQDRRNSNESTSAVQDVRNYFPTDASRDSMSRNFQVEFYKKDKEIATLKFELAQREKDLENQLRESKDKLRTLEMDSIKIASLEEELKNTKLELSVLQKKKEEETASLLQRLQELQESLDKKIQEYISLEKYIQFIKDSYRRVFGY